MIEYFTRFDDYLLVTTIVDDPVYFSEPFIRTTEYTADSTSGARSRRSVHSQRRTDLLQVLSGRRDDSRQVLSCRTICPARTTCSTSSPRSTRCHAGPWPSGRDDVSGIRVSVSSPAAIVTCAAAPANAPAARSAAPTASARCTSKGKVWAIFGAGGNITVQIGDEGVLVVDTGTSDTAAGRSRGDSAARRRPANPLRHFDAFPCGPHRGQRPARERARSSAQRFSRTRTSALRLVENGVRGRQSGHGHLLWRLEGRSTSTASHRDHSRACRAYGWRFARVLPRLRRHQRRRRDLDDELPALRRRTGRLGQRIDRRAESDTRHHRRRDTRARAARSSFRATGGSTTRPTSPSTATC